MRTMRQDMGRRLERAADGVEPVPRRGFLSGVSWSALVRAVLAVQVARAAERVLERGRQRRREGRLGGEVSCGALAMPRPVAIPGSREQPRQPKPTQKDREGNA